MGAGKRLSDYIEKQGFTKKNFCEKFDFEYNNLTSIMTEKRSLGINLINQLHESLPNLNIHWLLYGEGEEEITSEILLVFNEPKEKYGKDKNLESLFLEMIDNERIKEKIKKIILEDQDKKSE